MGGRGTFAAGTNVDYTYETVGYVENVKVLKGINGKHALPESSHSSEAYIKLKADGTFHEMRLYDKDHVLYLEIAYHPEKDLTGDSKKSVLHYHVYDERFSRNKSGPFSRSEARLLTEEMRTTFGKYFKGVKDK